MLNERRVNLANLCDHEGRSVMTTGHLLARIAKLEADNQRLKKLIEAKVVRREFLDSIFEEDEDRDRLLSELEKL